MQRTEKQRRLCALALVLLALEVAHAFDLGKPGVVSQYEPFGRPITNPATVTTPAPASAPMQLLAVEGTGVGIGQLNAPQTGAAPAAAPAPAAAAGPKACDRNYEYSEIFGKCLPAPGTDGFIGSPQNVKGKDIGKAAPDQSASAIAPTPVLPIQSQPNMPLPLRAQSIAPTPAAPLAPAAPTPAPAPKPAAAATPAATASKPPAAPAPPAAASPAQRGAPAPARPLRLACPPGFMLHPALGTCIAPTQPQAMVGPPRMRGGEGEDDESEEMRRRHMMHRRFRNRMFGRGFGFFGRPQILAPVFVFVLPPIERANATNATNAARSGLGERKQIHEIHPSLVGRGDMAAPPGTARATEPSKPIAKPSEPAADRAKSQAQPQEQPRPKEAGETEAKAKRSDTGEREERPKALREAFVNPIVRGGGEQGVGAGTGKAQPLKAANADNSTEDKAKAAPSEEPIAKPLRVDAGVDDRTVAGKPSAQQTVQALQRRGAFVNPFVASRESSAAA